MASAHEGFESDENVATGGDVESASDGKGQSHHVDNRQDPEAPAISLRPTRTFEAPEFIRNMTPDERRAVETKLKRKIDFRLMPMIILMYILNYLDRVSAHWRRTTGATLMMLEQYRCRQIGRYRR